MKEYIKHLVTIIGSVIALYISYQLSFIINGFYNLDAAFNSVLTNEYIYIYLIIIKGLIFLLSYILLKKLVPVMLAFVGTLLGNLGAFFYIVMIMDIFPEYIVLSINFGIDLILMISITLLVDFISNKVAAEDNHIEEDSDNSIDSNVDHVFMTNEIIRLTEEINNKNNLLKQLDEQIQKSQTDLAKINHCDFSISDEELKGITETETVTEATDGDSLIFQSIKETDDNPGTESKTESEKFESIGIFSKSNTFELPLRIEIGERAKRVPSKSSDERRHKIKEDRLKKESELKKKEQDLNERIEQFNKKEEIIDKTIANLEQISKSIKERMKLLDEKENYLKNQMEKLDQDQDQEGYTLHKQIYETIFKSPEIMEDEVKLKDNAAEIIINKNDLDEIRQLIEGMTNQ